MRSQFVIGTNVENTIDIDVTREPTEEEVKVIEDEIHDIMDLYEEENGDFAGFDWYDCIYETVVKHIPIAKNQIVKTIYI